MPCSVSTIDLAVDEHGDTVACPREGVQIVRHHHDGEAAATRAGTGPASSKADGRDGIEPGGRLVEEQQRRVERERAGERDALHHAARELRGKLVAAASSGSPTMRSRSSTSCASGLRGEIERLDHRQG